VLVLPETGSRRPRIERWAAIHNPVTIPSRFRDSNNIHLVRKGLIKVDGTFA
jgi:hypothetical protein